MKVIEVCIKNEYGLHARPASLLANTASQFQSNITIIKDEKEVNAKSIMNLLLLAAGKDTVLKLSADGPDEDGALSAIKELIEVRKFDEE
jgi:phosphocarrier protein